MFDRIVSQSQAEAPQEHTFLMEPLPSSTQLNMNPPATYGSISNWRTGVQQSRQPPMNPYTPTQYHYPQAAGPSSALQQDDSFYRDGHWAPATAPRYNYIAQTNELTGSNYEYYTVPDTSFLSHAAYAAQAMRDPSASIPPPGDDPRPELEPAVAPLRGGELEDESGVRSNVIRVSRQENIITFN